MLNVAYRGRGNRRLSSARTSSVLREILSAQTAVHIDNQLGERMNGISK